MSLAFLALPVIPSLKITDHGLVDVDRFELVGLEVDLHHAAIGVGRAADELETLRLREDPCMSEMPEPSDDRVGPLFVDQPLADQAVREVAAAEGNDVAAGLALELLNLLSPGGARLRRDVVPVELSEAL